MTAAPSWQAHQVAVRNILRRPTLQPKLTIGAPNDRYEQEADRVADTVMRMPDSEINGKRLTGQQTADPRIQRMCSVCEEEIRRQPVEEEEEELPQTKPLDEAMTPLIQRLIRRQPVEDEEDESIQREPSARTGLTRTTEPSIPTLGPGRPLSGELRDYFEPRFDQDFGQVRVHADPRSAGIAHSLNARAFTLGRHVVFGAGQYEPKTPDGRRLLAHELTHTVQQGKTVARRSGAHEHSISRVRSAPGGETLQRATIDYRQLTWKDFKGAVPASPANDAWTKAFIETYGSWRPKSKTTNTNKPCTVGKNKTKEYKVTVSVPATEFDAVRARMNQDASWATQRVKNVSGHCKSKVKDCKQHFVSAFKKINTACSQHVKKCQDAFKQRLTSWSLPIDGKNAVADKSADCATTFKDQCLKFSRDLVSYSLQVTKAKQVFATAKTKKDCQGKQFSKDCNDFLQKLSAKLLSHEQGHFDLAKVMADKTKAALVAKAATLVAEETRCGNKSAKQAASEAFKKLDAGTQFQQIYNDGNDGKNQADIDYDNDTTHGLKEKEEAAWKKKIKDGLKAYQVPKPAKQQTTPTTP